MAYHRKYKYENFPQCLVPIQSCTKLAFLIFILTGHCLWCIVGQGVGGMAPLQLPTPKAPLPSEFHPSQLSPFIASKCFNFYGQVQVQLHCPYGHGIRTLIAFTAISRYDDCYYEPWDCIVQPITSHRCEGRTTCFISDQLDGNTIAQWGPLVCGEGTTPYLHIEYECPVATDFALNTDPGDTDTKTSNTSYDNNPQSHNQLTRMVIEKQNESENEVTSEESATEEGRKDEEEDDKPKTGSPFLVLKPPPDYSEEDVDTHITDTFTTGENVHAPNDARRMTFFDNKLIFSSIIGGSIVGVSVVIALLGMLIKRIKDKTYEDSSLYGPRHRRDSHSSASDVSYMLREYPLRSRDFLAYLQSQRNLRAHHAQQLRGGDLTSSYT